MDIQTRHATLKDLGPIVEIYNETVVDSTATFDTEPKSIEQRLEWFEAHDARHPILVAVVANEIAGWASLSKWNVRPAYDDTVESSVYVKRSYQRKGIGRLLQAKILQAACELQMHTVLAQITDENEHSVRLHESFGFQIVGTLHEVGLKFGRRLNVHILQLRLK